MKRWWLVIALLLSVGLNLGILGAIVAVRRAPQPGPREPRPGAEAVNPAADPLPRLPRLADRLGLVARGGRARRALGHASTLRRRRCRAACARTAGRLVLLVGSCAPGW